MNRISALIKTDMKGMICFSLPSCENTVRKKLSMNQEECSHQTPGLLAP